MTMAAKLLRKIILRSNANFFPLMTSSEACAASFAAPLVAPFSWRTEAFPLGSFQTWHHGRAPCLCHLALEAFHGVLQILVIQWDKTATYRNIEGNKVSSQMNKSAISRGNIENIQIQSSKPPQKSHEKKLHHRRPQTVAQIAHHEISETSPEHGHARAAGKQDGTKDRRQAGLGDEPRRRTQHPRQAGRQDQRQEKDKPRGADTASQMKDKLRDKTKTKAGRQGQRQEKDKTREADRAPQTRW